MIKEISSSGKLLSFLDSICDNFRIFVGRNESFFTILFSLLISIEQIILLYFISRIEKINFVLLFTINTIIIVILLTFLLEKVIYEVRNKISRRIITDKELEIGQILIENKNLLYEYNLLKEKFSNYLDKNKKI